MPAQPHALVIDPGGSAFGWSLWPTHRVPTEAGVYTPEKGRGWIRNIQSCATELDFLLEQYRPKLLISEMPFFSTEGSGLGTASSGSLQKLNMFVGAIIMVQHKHRNLTQLKFVEVRDWKPQTKGDTLVRQRVTARLSKAKCDALGLKSHAWDSVGIGLYFFTGRL